MRRTIEEVLRAKEAEQLAACERCGTPPVEGVLAMGDRLEGYQAIALCKACLAEWTRKFGPRHRRKRLSRGGHSI